MTSPRNSSPTLAVVLGGGGSVGVGWQTGLLTGLREAGVDLARADAVVGTSAGALVGALLASGREVTEALTCLAALGRSLDPDSLAAAADTFRDARRQASLATDLRQGLKAIGRAAQESSMLTEDAYLSLFAILENATWPARFRCTAIDTDTGDLVVWHERSSVPLLRAVAASCSVPQLFPTITIEGRRYTDGGLLSHLNAPAAPPTDVLVALSCHPLGTQGTGLDSALAASAARTDADLAQLGETRRLITLEPDFGDGQAPANMMDPNLTVHAHQVGKQQAERVAETIQAAWNR